MKTLHFDCYAGISGDMALGALVDLGVDPGVLRSELEKLGVDGWKLEFVEDERGGIRGLHAAVELEGETGHIASDDGGLDHHHHHEEGISPHNHDHHGISHNHSGSHSGHVHRSWKDIRALIENSGIRPGARKRALAIFNRIAEAEAEVHGKPVGEVTFHEVGALDSIVDVVGTAICLDLLNPGRITAGPIELGGGMVKCAHGILPVPAPAVLILVRGLPVTSGGFNKEMTTPTGAAVIAASVDEFITQSSFTEIKTGYGIGTRRMERPNLLRVSLREAGPAHGPVTGPADSPPETGGALPPCGAGSGVLTEELVLLEANIDDMTGEALGFLMERLFEAGALDVTITPCVMKKSRPGSIVSVLCPPGKLESLRQTMFRKSATIGFRETVVRRIALKREEGKFSGDFGDAKTKKVYYGEQLLRHKIEYEDRAALARKRNISLEEAEQCIENGNEV